MTTLSDLITGGSGKVVPTDVTPEQKASMATKIAQQQGNELPQGWKFDDAPVENKGAQIASELKPQNSGLPAGWSFDEPSQPGTEKNQTELSTWTPSTGEKIVDWWHHLFGMDQKDIARAMNRYAEQKSNIAPSQAREAVGGMSEIPEQFVSKGVHTATLGVIPDVAGNAQTTSGGVAGGAGQLTGFMLGAPVKVAQALVAPVTKGATLSHIAGESFVSALSKDVASQAATLGVAGSLSEIGNALDSPDVATAFKKEASAFADNAKTGAVFGVAGRVLPDTTLMQGVARAVGVSAALDVANGKKPFEDIQNFDQLSPEQKGSAIFNYGMNLLFTLKGAGRTSGGWMQSQKPTPAETPEQPLSPHEQAKADAEVLQSGQEIPDADPQRIKNASLVAMMGDNKAVEHAIDSGNQQIIDSMLAVSPRATDALEKIKAKAAEAEPTAMSQAFANAKIKPAEAAKEAPAEAAETPAETPKFQTPEEVSTQGFADKAQSLGLTPEQSAALAPAHVTDHVTGFERAEEKVPTVKRAQQFAKDTGQSAHFVDADIANLSGLNSFFNNDASKANVVFRGISDIFADEMKKAGVQAVPIRHGGDEISAVVIGGTKDSINTAIENTKARVADYVHEQGLADIEHPKHIGNKMMAGVGLHMGQSEIGPKDSLADIFDRASKGVDASKKGVPFIERRAQPTQPEVTEKPAAQPERPLSRVEMIKAEKAANVEKIAEASKAAAHHPENAAPLPTEAQHAAGNYPKGHVNLNGLDITIENPKGSVRTGMAEGKSWQVKMQNPYGYIRKTEGADGDHMDVYLGDHITKDSPAFVIDQIDPKTGKFDESKTILGARGYSEAKDIYDRHFSDRSGPERRAAITKMSMKDFKEWIKSGDTKKPLNTALAKRLTEGGIGNSELSRDTGFGATTPEQLNREPNVPLVGPTSEVGGVKAATGENVSNRAASNAKPSANLSKADILRAEAKRLIKTPREQAESVDHGMLSLGHNGEVGRRVIEPVPVDMMNDLSGKKGAPKNILHNEPVLETLTPHAVDLNADKTITSPMPGKVSDMSAAARSAHDTDNNALQSNKQVKEEINAPEATQAEPPKPKKTAAQAAESVLAARKLYAYPTEAAAISAEKRQRTQGFDEGKVIPHPTEKGKFAVVPADQLKMEQSVEEYGGEHRPPGPDGGAPLNDLTGNGTVYPDDIYSSKAAQYYGHFGNNDQIDRETISIIQSMRNRPNASVKIYRAVPKIENKEEKLNALNEQMRQFMRRGTVPVGEEKKGWYDRAVAERNRLQELPDETPEKMVINHGDWVTINRAYAKDHGESTLNGKYKILTKTVKAKELFTNGDSIHEFGYWKDGKISEKETSELKQPEEPYNETHQANKAEPDIYEGLDVRPDTTEKQKQLGRDAYREILSPYARRAGAKVLGSRIAKDFQEQGGTALHGQEAKTPEDFAVLAQVLRDPRIEKSRIFYTKGDKILSHDAFTSNNPGSVSMVTVRPGETMETAINRVMDDIIRQKEALGADGYWLEHNHPAGRAKPSEADIRFTKYIASKIDGFKGHIVIDHNEYARIHANGDYGIVSREFPIHFGENAEIPHNLLGSQLKGFNDVVDLSKQLERKEGFFTLIGHDANHKVSAIAEFPDTLLDDGAVKELRLRATLKRFAAQTGSMNVIAVTGRENIQRLEDLVQKGVIVDAVTREGYSARQFVEYGKKTLFGKQRALAAEQPEETYQAKSRLIRQGEEKPEETVMDKAKHFIGKVKDSFDELKKAYVSPPEFTETKKIIGEYTGKLQEIDYGLSRLAHSINKEYPRDRQEAITNYIQAGGDETVLRDRAAKSPEQFRKGYEDAINLSPKEKELAEFIQKQQDDYWKKANEAGIIEHYIDNYVRGQWERENTAGQKIVALVNSGVLNDHPREAMQKVFQNYAEGEQAGFIPKDKRIGFQFVAGNRSIRAAIAAREALTALMHSTEKDGRPTVAIGGGGSIMEAGSEEKPYFVKPNIKPKDSLDYKTIDHPALRGWKWVGSDAEGKPILMHGQMYIHPDAYGKLNALLGKSKVRTFELPKNIPVVGGTRPGEAMLKTGAFIKSTILIGPFHQFHLGEHAVFHGVNPVGVPEINFDERPALREGIYHGLMLYNHNAMHEFAEGLSTGGLWHRLPVVGDGLKRYQEWLFQDYIPRLKAAMFEKALSRAEEEYAEQLRSGKLTRDQLLDNVAKQANAAFGEMNYKYMARDPSYQDALRIALLAPDFLEARMKFFAQAVRPYGKEQAMALVRGAAIMALGAQTINMMFGDDKKMHWDRPFSVIINGREYSPRSVVGDIAHLVEDPRGFWFHRINPLWGRPLYELSTGRNVQGQKETLDEGIENILKSWVPIPAQGIFKDQPELTMTQSIVNTLLQSIGVSNFQTKSPAEKMIHDFNFDKMPQVAMTDEQMAKRKILRDIEAKIRLGEQDKAQQLFQEGQAKHIITGKDYAMVIRRSTRPQIVNAFKHLDYDQAQKVWEVASPEEKKILELAYTEKKIAAAKKNAQLGINPP